MSDWEEVRARLEEVVEGVTSDEYFVEAQPADIRAALQRESEIGRERDAFVAVLDPEGHNVVTAMVNARALRQRESEQQDVVDAARAEVQRLLAIEDAHVSCVDWPRERTLKAEAEVERLREALWQAGQWVAAVDPKLPMPGTGDSQQEVLDMIGAALRGGGKPDEVPLDSPNFRPKELDEFAARGFKRINRGLPGGGE